jgi:hypothetical protein
MCQSSASTSAREDECGQRLELFIHLVDPIFEFGCAPGLGFVFDTPSRIRQHAARRKKRLLNDRQMFENPLRQSFTFE